MKNQNEIEKETERSSFRILLNSVISLISFYGTFYFLQFLYDNTPFWIIFPTWTISVGLIVLLNIIVWSRLI